MSENSESCGKLEEDPKLLIKGVLEIDTSEEDLNIIKYSLMGLGYDIIREFQDKENKISHLHYEKSSEYENA